MSKNEDQTMQTVLGANGQIAEELARELRRNFTDDIRLVSRSPNKVDEADQLLAADLMDPVQAASAVEGSEVVYLTVGLPMDSQLWEDRFPTMMRNTIEACKQHTAKLVYFDNTYMYPGTSTPQTEADTEFAPNGRKGRVRAEIATMLLAEMDAKSIDAAICRAPEFYGPGKTNSLSNAMFFDRIREGKLPFVPLSASTKRSLIWTPDASSGTALVGNTPDAFGKTWHLPIDENRLTYREMADIAGELLGKSIRPVVLPRFAFSLGGRFVDSLAEIVELLPRYANDNLFDCSAFAERFPDFRAKTYREGIAELLG